MPLIRPVLNSHVDNEGIRTKNKTEANVCTYTVVPLLALLKNECDKRVDFAKHIHLVIGTRLLKIVSSSQII